MIVYLVGIAVPIMEPDAATYAIISMEMIERGNWLDITARGQDWLDKPHFQFWVTALSYEIFGVNHVGFKIPAILFTLLGMWYTFKFAAYFYNRWTAFFSVVILLSSLHLVLSNNDIRAEPYLLGLTMFSLYYFAKHSKEKRFLYLIIGSAGVACLMMTKGLFAILPVAGAVFFHLLVNRQWKEILHWQWLAAGGLVVLFMAPTLYGYYQQFDLHPEKELFGQTGVSGIRFFFWDSQWGRFTNTGPITGAGDPFFFSHSLLWAMAPWAFLAYYGLFLHGYGLVKRKETAESYTFFGFLVVVLIMSTSRFQLPHYLVPLFPFLSIIAANSLSSALSGRTYRILNGLQMFTVLLLFVLVIGLVATFGAGPPSVDTLLVLAGTAAMCLNVYWLRGKRLKKLMVPPALALLAIMYYMNRDFYPALMKYQSESEVAFYAREQGLDENRIVCYQRNQWVTDFYLKRTVTRYGPPEILSLKTDDLVYTTDFGLEEIQAADYEVNVLISFPDFHVTTLTPEFISKATREETLATMYLVRIE